jgi:hypothetical protein
LAIVFTTNIFGDHRLFGRAGSNAIFDVRQCIPLKQELEKPFFLALRGDRMQSNLLFKVACSLSG